jgi:hypothetical protein
VHIAAFGQDSSFCTASASDPRARQSFSGCLRVKPPFRLLASLLLEYTPTPERFAREVFDPASRPQSHLSQIQLFVTDC